MKTKIFLIGAIMIAIMASCSSKEDDEPGIASVNMNSSSFLPPQITISAGTTVTWTNGNNMDHTVTSAGLFDQFLEPGQTFSYTFNNTGVFPYVCTLHQGMSGVVTVQ